MGSSSFVLFGFAFPHVFSWNLIVVYLGVIFFVVFGYWCTYCAPGPSIDKELVTFERLLYWKISFYEKNNDRSFVKMSKNRFDKLYLV